MTRHPPNVTGISRIAAGGLMFVVLVTLPSCSPANISTDYVAREGTIESVDVSRKTVTFRFQHDQTGEYRRETGYVLDDTEILIDGRLATLSDIRPGERVSTVWKIRKVAGQSFVSALKIHVTRDVEAAPS